ncbi:MAG: sugar ABC transporter ATP-binding protein [Patulibacter sp.]
MSTPSTAPGHTAQPGTGFAPRLIATNIVKQFGSHRALDEVNLTVGDGEVVGLIGENGAGKSTLLNIISGVFTADDGHLQLDGQTIAPRSYQEANRHGIFRVFQEPALIDALPVYENVFFGWERLFRTRRGTLDRAALRRASQEALGEAGVGEIDVRIPVGDLRPAARQSLDIARVTALSRRLEVERPVVLFDEPTTALDQDHEENFLRLLERLRGVASVVFVSHRLPEIIRTTDRIAVLKDGENAGERLTQGVDEGELHRLMVGRVRSENYYREREQLHIAADATPRLEVRALSGAGVLRGASLEVAPGEILGIAGTEGSGKRVLGEVIAGIVPASNGEVFVDGQAPQDGIAGHVASGIAYVPPDRQRNGLISGASIVENVQLASLGDRFSTGTGRWKRAEARAAAQRYVDELGVVARGIDAPISSLSGGNAQKVLLAKWLVREPTVLVLDAPTQGVDTGAREGIYDLIRAIAASGAAVVLISDDLPELIGLSNRIAVITDGELTRTVDAPPDHKPDEHELVAWMIPGHATLTTAA